MYDDNEPTMMGASPPTAALIVRQGPQAGMSFPITGNQVIIGREEGMGIVLQDPEASRRHARISWQAQQFVIEDMGSTNGTFVNGVQLTAPQRLNAGDSIGIGQTALVFQLSGGHMGPAVPPPQQAPVYSPPEVAVAPASQEGRTTQYLLYGCGGILLLCICCVLAIIAWAFIDFESFKNVTGLEIGMSLRTIQTFLSLG